MPRFDEDDACEAFPGGIPAEILGNRFDHCKSYPGDHGLKFSLEEGADLPFQQWLVSHGDPQEKTAAEEYLSSRENQ